MGNGGGPGSVFQGDPDGLKEFFNILFGPDLFSLSRFSKTILSLDPDDLSKFVSC